MFGKDMLDIRQTCIYHEATLCSFLFFCGRKPRGHVVVVNGRGSKHTQNYTQTASCGAVESFLFLISFIDFFYRKYLELYSDRHMIFLQKLYVNIIRMDY